MIVGRDPRVTAVPHVDEGALAWALIEAAKPHLTARERSQVFVTVGAGDTFAVIRALIKLAAAKKIPLRPRLVQLCATWLGAYTLHSEYEPLHRIINDRLMPIALEMFTTIERLPAAPASPATAGSCNGQRSQ